MTEPQKEVSGVRDFKFTIQDIQSFMKILLAQPSSGSSGIDQMQVLKTLVREVTREVVVSLNESRQLGETQGGEFREVESADLRPNMGSTRNDVMINIDGEDEIITFGNESFVEESIALIKFMSGNTSSRWLLVNGHAPYHFIPNSLSMYSEDSIYDTLDRGRTVFAGLIASRILSMMKRADRNVEIVYKDKRINVAEMARKFVDDYQSVIKAIFGKAQEFSPPDLTKVIPSGASVLFTQYIVTYYRLLTYIFDVMTAGRKDKFIEMYLMPNEYFMSYFSREGTTSDRTSMIARSMAQYSINTPKDSFWALFPDGRKHFFLELYPNSNPIDG